nr:ectonucleoside triphosphate diphosphohydrolase 8 isoform X1 [Camelus dromedarius]
MGLTQKERVFTVLLGFAAVSGLVTLILILVEATNVLLPADTKFGIVVDAGSSHTSLFVYQWPADKENDTGVVSQALACQVEGPGISSYTSDPEQAGESLQGCLEEALALIPEAQHQETPMFLGATAGMRLLSQKNSSQAEDIFAAVSRVLGQSPLDFWGAELLGGQDEGAFGWITINYILGKLVKVPRAAPGPGPDSRLRVSEAGPGTQCPLSVLSTPSPENGSHLWTGRWWAPWTWVGPPRRSLLCPGSPYWTRAPRPPSACTAPTTASTPTATSASGVTRCSAGSWQGWCRAARAPWSATLATTAATGTRCPWPPCTSRPVSTLRRPQTWPRTSRWRGWGTPGPASRPSGVSSTSPAAAAEATVPSMGSTSPPCGASSTPSSHYYHTFHFLNLTSGQPLATVNATIWDFCQRPWKLVEASSPGQDRWLRDYCASGLYILTLLLEGYGFREETWPSIKFRKQASGMDIGWTLGYMLNLTNMTPAEAPAQWRAQSYGVWAAGLVFMVLTLAAILGAAALQLFWLQD